MCEGENVRKCESSFKHRDPSLGRATSPFVASLDFQTSTNREAG